MSSIPPSTPGKAWQPPAPEELAPELPQYEILGLLGRGGMGAVYKAVQKSLGRVVAIKLLPPSIEDADMNYGERFQAEAKSMARLNHPGIIAVYDAGETPSGLLYFVMEYVEGTDVHQMIASSGKLPPQHAHAITAHVCDALAYAHANGLIHRDIKPANIMVDTQGRVKVADFGLAKMANDDHGFTKSNMAVGTPDFVAPEALIAGMPVDGRADLYAVGVMLYQMLTGQIPRGAWHPASVMVPGVDVRFDHIITKAMQYDREARHSSAVELRQHLDTLLMPSTAAPDLQRYSSTGMAKAAAPPQPQGGRSVRQNAAPGASPAPQPRTLASAPTAKSKTPLFISLGAAATLAVGAIVLFSDRSPKTVAEAAPASASPPDHALAGAATSPAPKPQTLASLPTTPDKVAITPKPESAPILPVKPQSLSDTPSPQVGEATKAEQTSSLPATAQMITPSSTTASTPTPAAPPPPAPSTPPSLPSPSSPTASALDQRLTALDAGFQAAVERDAGAAFKVSMAALDKLYLGALERSLAAASKGGKLEEAIALREEKQRIEKGEGVPSEVDESTLAPGKVPDSLKTLRQTYRSTTAQHEATKAKAMQPLYDKYDQALAAVQTELTQSQKLDDAMRVKTVREQVAATRSSGGNDVVASSSPSASTSDHALAGAATKAPSSTLLATKDKPFTNSLGMKFVTVTGTDVLFCIHETRRQDYAAYATEIPGVDGSWKNQMKDGIPAGHEDNHPVVGVSWDDAQAFCQWLSKKEGRAYRLPTDKEWSYAVGIGREEKWTKDSTPASFAPYLRNEFPWGADYPPKTKDQAGNYADTEYKAKFPTQSSIEGYTDGFATTAPVMSFKPNRLGIYDLGGNVSEWVEDYFRPGVMERVQRGCSWVDSGAAMLPSAIRPHSVPAGRNDHCGFRIVVETRNPANTDGAAAKPATPTPTPPAAPPPTPTTAAKSDFTNSLGMKFVKVPGTKVLFCIHETRYKDYATFVAAVPTVNPRWTNQTLKNVAPKDRTDDHPVVIVSWEDAQAFCAWLSQKEGKRYRLPTDEEWSYAAGIGRDEKRKKGDTPGTIASVPNEYPWGTKWPPSKGCENYGDESYKAAIGEQRYLKGYDDGYPTTAPVMSFKPNRYGLYDMGGNVSEWCEDWLNDTQTSRVLRGSSWKNGANDFELLSSYRGQAGITVREDQFGFRIVLETTD